jgi:hypothetical protein
MAIWSRIRPERAIQRPRRPGRNTDASS